MNNVFVTGMLFNLAVLVFIWPFLAALFSPSLPVWGGVPVLNQKDAQDIACVSGITRPIPDDLLFWIAYGRKLLYV